MGGDRRRGPARGRPRRGRARERSDPIGAPCRGVGVDRVILAIALALIFLAVTALVIVGASVRVLREYERGVVFRLGRVTSQRGPGIIFLAPVLDRMVRVSLRTVTLEIPAQEIITR